jgi:hypothetical protein
MFEKYSNIKFHEDTCGGRRFVPCRRTDMQKLIVAFRNFTNPYKYAYTFIIILMRVPCPAYVIILHFITNDMR